MKQRVVVQAVIESEGKTLLLRRAQGRPSAVGKYELPGGTLVEGEQPDDGLRRHLKNDAGIAAESLVLRDAMSMASREDGDVQHVFIVYSVEGVAQDTPVHLTSAYDEYAWKSISELQQNELRDSAFYLLRATASDQDDTINPVMSINTVVNNASKKHDSIRHVIYSDGGSRGNPGPSAAAFVVLDEHEQVIEQGEEYLGITTNNQAEYHGVRLGLEKAAEMGLRRIDFRVDSMLVANQLRGMYKIKNRELWPINERIVELVKQFESVTFMHVPREQNHMADALVNKCLDSHKADRPIV